MCIIASKPAGIEMPRAQYIRNMFNNNDDGAGLMYAVNNKVHIAKGFMDYASFQNKLDDLDAVYGLKNLPLVMHFRITTHGGTNPENCHPFPIADSEGLLKKLRCKTDIGVAHNGVIEITPRKGISDTMEYIISQLAPLKKAAPLFYQNKWLLKMIYNAIDSKMVIMDSKGEVTYIGDFKEEDGIKYSNSSYAYSYKYSDFPYSIGASDDAMYEGYYYDQRELMWLDESKGEYVQDPTDGDMWSGDFAIDSDGMVYEYCYDYNTWTSLPGFTAHTSEGMALAFNPFSKYTSMEIVLL